MDDTQLITFEDLFEGIVDRREDLLVGVNSCRASLHKQNQQVIIHFN